MRYRRDYYIHERVNIIVSSIVHPLACMSSWPIPFSLPAFAFSSQVVLEKQTSEESSCRRRFDAVAAEDLRQLELELTRAEMLLSSSSNASSTRSRLAGDVFPAVARQCFNAAATTAASAASARSESQVEKMRLQLLYAQNELLQVLARIFSYSYRIHSFIQSLN